MSVLALKISFSCTASMFAINLHYASSRNVGLIVVLSVVLVHPRTPLWIRHCWWQVKGDKVMINQQKA